MEMPVYTRPGPVRRNLIVRIVVTVLCLALMANSLLWLDAIEGPTGAFVFILVVPVDLACLGLLHWAWKRHAF